MREPIGQLRAIPGRIVGVPSPQSQLKSTSGSAALPALVSEGVVAARDAREGGDSALRPEVARALSEADLAGERRIVPAAVDVVVLAWRAEAVRAVGARIGAQPSFTGRVAHPVCGHVGLKRRHEAEP